MVAEIAALAADARGRIVVVNTPFLEWLGGMFKPVIGTPLLRCFPFHLQEGRTVETLWQKLGSAWLDVGNARMIHIAPGLVLALNVPLARAIAARGKSLCVIWITK